MLYKKYHRNLVKQFKRGKKAIRFSCDVSHKATIAGLVVSNRYIFSTYIAIDVVEEDINREGCWIIIFSNGSINRSIIISNAV